MNRFFPGLLTVIVSAPFLAQVAQAQTPLARLTQIQQKVELSAGTGSAFRAVVKAGVPLARGSVVRTGRRSKADIKFSDGSLVRLGQLSSVEVRGPRQVQVGGGNALISWLSPGKIGTSYAAAEIKGTIVHIAVTDEGATFTLYEGATEIVTAKGSQELRPGTAVFVRPDGTLSGLRDAAPIFFAQAGTQLELKDGPKTGAFVGSEADVAVKSSATRVGLRDLLNDARRPQVSAIARPTPLPTPATPPAPTPAPTTAPTTAPTPAPTTAPTTAPTVAPTPTKTPTKKLSGGKKARRLGGGTQNRASQATPSVLERLSSLEGPSALPRFPLGRDDPARLVWAQIPFTLGQNAGLGLGTDALKTDQVAQDDFDSPRAQQRLDELSGAGGKSSGFDARALGIIGDGGTSAYGARISGFVARGNYLLQGTVTPLKVRANDQTFDLSAVSDLSLTYRNPKVEVQAGRQRFLAGPTQATLYGSLVRQGGREIMDAIRIAKPFGAQRLEAAYLVDAYPRNLPFRVGGLQQGFYARYSQQKKTNLGVNLIKYFDLDRSSKLGASLDFAAPVSGGVDFYGEGGIDTFGRGFGALGLSFPEFYARSGFDVYLESAYVGSSNNAPRPPAEFALRAYRSLGDNLDLVGSVSRFSNGDTSALIGVSVGSKRSR